uniref:NADH-ubiquinone oxidoreductase chain 2 n=3 Tax=Stenocephalemys TaxID=89456 RepID=A0A866VWW5_9MURI|nr:NADH dehydrogenase subunit 2 [Stenocephalemys ruppi]YP_009946504.1 NADH dehydrogenase subunit 2 [Stenocephalemys griseicauda]QOE76144.1 NADH dehydrogenase subunit 2 [Stenocephalemys albipes]QOE76196.1 NADH dehydrogenase subunit 2 [Stenocephalemys ruppi]QOE76209.1 NADH dehydrogenase subunit 2 [Stenocephalemys ruppi]QOE76274.1 NADH dehydrogenase subunit 2 [Stenocephalemys albipes]QOE76287.1 NADH dehydrogenase subunit 2 [Stenocephalemys griseicauda]
MNPITMTMIYFTIFMGPIITMSSSNLLLMWVGLELSLLAMVPLLINKKNPRSTEAATKYFITQATASMIILLAIILNYKQLGTWMFQQQTNNLILTMTLISLSMKLGLAPFHYWLPEVTQGIELHTGLILLTWQKIAPLSILFQIYNLINPTITMILAILSIFMGAWGGLNQTQMRKIMAYSSIAHMGWMLAIITFNPSLTLLNLLIYIILTIPMFMMLKLNSSTTMNSISLLWNKTPTTLTMMSIILLSLGGLPPLTGFLPKWIIITELLKNNCIILTTMMAMMALLNLFFYTRLIYSISLTMFPTNNNSKMLSHLLNPKHNFIIPLLTITSTMTLPISPQLIT